MFVARHLYRRLPSSSAALGTLAKAYAASSAATQHIEWRPASIATTSYNIQPPIASTSSASLPTRLFSSSSLKDSYKHILTERRFPEDTSGIVGGGVGIITLHRPKALNALCDALFEDLIHAVRALENDDDVGCIVITGSGKAFAAGKIQY